MACLWKKPWNKGKCQYPSWIICPDVWFLLDGTVMMTWTRNIFLWIAWRFWSLTILIVDVRMVSIYFLNQKLEAKHCFQGTNKLVLHNNPISQLSGKACIPRFWVLHHGCRHMLTQPYAENRLGSGVMDDFVFLLATIAQASLWLSLAL